jgi:hypothetical protein
MERTGHDSKGAGAGVVCGAVLGRAHGVQGQCGRLSVGGLGELGMLLKFSSQNLKMYWKTDDA